MSTCETTYGPDNEEGTLRRPTNMGTDFPLWGPSFIAGERGTGDPGELGSLRRGEVFGVKHASALPWPLPEKEPNERELDEQPNLVPALWVGG